ncbi:MAG: trypsin-like peptidase domain-containing protein [Planctomycetes bacterium]|nr:trypsin-like peptidase domain-containing protein [Planctomycetota bacterium]
MSMKVKSTKQVFQQHWSRMLSAVILSCLAVLGGITLSQQRQLSAIQGIHTGRANDQVTIASQLVQSLISLQNELDQKITAVITSQMASYTQQDQAVRQTELQEMQTTLTELSGQVQSLNQQLPQAKDEKISQELLAGLGELREQIDRSKSQVEEILSRYLWSEEIMEEYSNGVCLIQGEYQFVDPKSAKALRYVEPEISDLGNSATWRSQDSGQGYGLEGFYPVSVTGKGEVLKVQYTGTGFLIDKDGTIVTNRHVTEPWTISKTYQHLISAGYRAEHTLFRAFFPGQAKPFKLTVVRRSKHEDVALLRVKLGQARIPVLVCETDPDQLKVGQTVIVVGYPTGFDVLLARMSETELDAIVGTGEITFSQMAQNMAQRNLIYPIPTRGMCGRVSSNKIVYDAPTAIGGSGAPVLGTGGKVVGINTALMKGFSGTNFGIPIRRALALLEMSDEPEALPPEAAWELAESSEPIERL